MARLEAAQRRVDFVEATVRTIAKFGVTGATTRRICEEAGSPLASLHYVFKSKDDLFDAVFNHVASDISPKQGEFLETPISVLATLMMRRVMHWLKANPDHAIAQAELFYWALRRNKKLASDYDYHTAYKLKQILTDSKHQLNELQIEQISRLSMTLIEGQLSNWFAQKNEKMFTENLEISCKALSLFIATLSHQTDSQALLEHNFS